MTVHRRATERRGMIGDPLDVGIAKIAFEKHQAELQWGRTVLWNHLLTAVIVLNRNVEGGFTGTKITHRHDFHCIAARIARTALLPNTAGDRIAQTGRVRG